MPDLMERRASTKGLYVFPTEVRDFLRLQSKLFKIFFYFFTLFALFNQIELHFFVDFSER